MAKITYDNKITLNEQPDIANVNKVTSGDMNEIKSIVNTNDDTLISHGTLISNITGTILWTNPSPTSSFAEQNITLSSSDYDLLEIFYNNGTSNTTCWSVRIKKGYSTEMQIITNVNKNTSQSTGVRVRSITYTNDTTLRVRDCLTRDGGSSSVPTVNNGGAIPLCVIGYKTGLFS